MSPMRQPAGISTLGVTAKGGRSTRREFFFAMAHFRIRHPARQLNEAVAVSIIDRQHWRIAFIAQLSG